jgi:hypothetical protein
MGRKATVLHNSSFIGSSAGTAFLYEGGRSILVLSANQYGGGVFLQTQSLTGKWVSINGTTYSADQVTAYDLPYGQFRLISNVGSSINLGAALMPVDYSD